MLLLVICLFLNYDLINCDHARKSLGRSHKSQLPAQMGYNLEHETDVFIKELREKMQRAQVEDSNPDFGAGLEDYNISPMDVFKTPKSDHIGENNNFLSRAKGRTLEVDNNEEFMNYDITNMFWTGTPKIGDTLEYTTSISFLPTPEGFQITSPPSLNPWQILDNLSSVETTTVPGPSTPYNSEYPDLLNNGVSSTQFKFDTPHVVFIPHYMLNSSVFPRPSFPFSVPPVSTPTPLMVPVPLTFDNTNDKEEQEDNDGSPPTIYTGPIDQWSTPLTKPVTTTTIKTVRTTTTTESTTTVSTLSPRPPIPIDRQHQFPAGPGVMFEPNDKIGMRTEMEMMDMANSLDWLNVTEATPDAVAKQPPEKKQIHSKVESKIDDKSWTKLIGGPVTEPTTPSQKYKPTTTPATTTIITDEPTQPFEASTMTVSYLGLLSPDTDGFMHVSMPTDLPEIPVHKDATATPTTAGDVLLGNVFTLTHPTIASPYLKYLQMMEDLDEGFLGVFLFEFTRLLSEKNIDHVKEVVTNAESIIVGLEETGALNFLGLELGEKAKTLSVTFSEAGQNRYSESFRKITEIAHKMIKERRTMISDEVNYLIDQACLFYNDDEGTILFSTLVEFESYPNGTLNGVDLCKRLLDAFFSPFRRLGNSARGIQLRNLAEAAVKSRFGRRMSYRGLTKLPDPETTILNHSNNYKQIYSLKRRMEMKRRRKNLTRRMFGTTGVFLAQQTNRPMGHPRLRSMLPITRNQKRFRVIAQRQRAVTSSANIERPTRNDHFRKSGRAIHPYNEMMQFFPQIPKEYLRHVL